MQLTDNQIELLFAFTKKKFVKHYDLQIELVDHLAESIDQIMNEDSSVSFEQALERVYKQFGIFGFSKIVQEKSAALQKQHSKLFWDCIKKQFSWPKVFGTLLLFLITYSVGIKIDSQVREIFLIGFYFLLFIISISMLCTKKTKKEKPLLLMNYANSTNGLFFSQYLIWHSILEINVFESVLTFTFFIPLNILFILANLQVRNTFYKQALSMYPEAFV